MALSATAYLAFDQAGSRDDASRQAQIGSQPTVGTAASPPADLPDSPAAAVIQPEASAGGGSPDADLPGLQARRTAGCALDHERGDFVETAPDGRSYRLHIPPGYDGRAALPLVLSFHGFGRSAVEQEAYSGFVPIADREGFILVTPEGSGYPPGWAISGVYDEDGVDDVAMTAALVRALDDSLCLDADRTYATGLSNGAEMASQVGCLLPDVFAAVAPVAGVVYQGCGGDGMALITFHGTNDFNVPFESAPPAVGEWSAHNGCAAIPVDESLSDAIERLTYSSCTAGADVVFYVIHGGGHTWPGADDEAGGVGPTTHEIAASELIWAFFVAHPRAQATAGS